MLSDRNEAAAKALLRAFAITVGVVIAMSIFLMASTARSMAQPMLTDPTGTILTPGLYTVPHCPPPPECEDCQPRVDAAFAAGYAAGQADCPPVTEGSDLEPMLIGFRRLPHEYIKVARPHRNKAENTYLVLQEFTIPTDDGYGAFPDIELKILFPSGDSWTQTEWKTERCAPGGTRGSCWLEPDDIWSHYHDNAPERVYSISELKELYESLPEPPPAHDWGFED